MSKAKKALTAYIQRCRGEGQSFAAIKKSLIAKGYPKKLAEGILFSYKHDGAILKSTFVVLLAGVLISSLYLSGSGIVGLVTLEFAQEFTDNLSLVIHESSSYTWYPNARGEIVSLAVTGSVRGEGSGRIYVQEGNKRYLLFDSAKEYEQSTRYIEEESLEIRRGFKKVCDETCQAGRLDSSVYDLVFEVDNVEIELDHLDFDVIVSDDFSGKPVFLEIPDQKGNIGSTRRINLSSFFTHTTINTTFAYLSDDDSIAVSITDGVASISLNKETNAYMYFIAEDNSEQFISNLVSFGYSRDHQEDEKIIQSGLKKREVQEAKEQPSGFSLSPLFIIVVIVLIAGTVVLATRAYTLTSLAKKIDHIGRKNYSASVKQYTKLRSALGWVKGSQKKEKAIVDMQRKIVSLAKKIPHSATKQEFKTLYDNFWKEKKVPQQKKMYNHMQRIYDKLMKLPLRAREKDILYKQLQKCYKRLEK